MDHDKSAGSSGLIMVILVVLLLLGGCCVVGGGGLLFLGARAPVGPAPIGPAKTVTKGTSGITFKLITRSITQEDDGSWIIEADVLNTGANPWTSFKVQSPKIFLEGEEDPKLQKFQATDQTILESDNNSRRLKFHTAPLPALAEGLGPYELSFSLSLESVWSNGFSSGSSGSSSSQTIPLVPQVEVPDDSSKPDDGSPR